jgi:hypothetical protein
MSTFQTFSMPIKRFDDLRSQIVKTLNGQRRWAMTSKICVANPLGYWCSPSGCTPEYQPASSIEDFLAYGIMKCSVDPADTICPVTPQDVADLREGFLNAVESAIRVWRQQETGRLTGCDLAEPTVTFDLADGDCTVGWVFDRVDDDALLFVMYWSFADDLAIWLSKGAIEGKEKEALDAIVTARRVLGL